MITGVCVKYQLKSVMAKSSLLESRVQYFEGNKLMPGAAPFGFESNRNPNHRCPNHDSLTQWLEGYRGSLGSCTSLVATTADHRAMVHKHLPDFSSSVVDDGAATTKYVQMPGLTLEAMNVTGYQCMLPLT